MLEAPSAPSSTRFHYAWIALAVTCLALMTGMGVRSNFGVYVKALEGEFHTTREPISRIHLLSLLLFACFQPVVGALRDRSGARAVLAGSMLLAGVGRIGMSLAPNLLTVGILYAILGGIASGAASATAGTAVCTRWFVKSRGLAMGIASAGNSTGQLIFFPLAMWLLVRAGWRMSYLWQGLFMACAVFPLVAWLARNDPRDKGLEAYGSGELRAAVAAGAPAPAPG